ncbi:YbjN domain-containing protein [Sphingomonas azotifigens]|uniref:YbjN domain-containing protein n=1 Tax=Sphingomonas azotifigens TaxID=330920 RepID=UPI000A03E9E0|nr:YbjN domain-containing protein [Sphingomonas azotifigens]
MRTWLLTALGLAIAVPAQAQVRSTEPQSIVKALQDAGYKAELTKDKDGDPLIRSAAQGYKFTIFFMNCEKNVKCGDIQFYAGWSDKLTPQRANDWNSKHRFARAYSDEQGEAALEYDVNLEDQAIPVALFRKDIDLWESLVGSFVDFITAAKDGAAKKP